MTAPKRERVPDRRWLWAAWDYDLVRALCFMAVPEYERKWRTYSHVLVIGPLAFVVCWRRPANGKVRVR